MRNEPKSLHHRIPRHGVDVLGTNDKRNKVMLPEHIHTNWHRIFHNMEFHYQILKVLEMNAPVVQTHVLREVAKIMRHDPEYIYQK